MKYKKKLKLAVVLTLILTLQLTGCAAVLGTAKGLPGTSNASADADTQTPLAKPNSTASLYDKEFDLNAFIDQVLFDTNNAPKMYIHIGSEDFYADINDALKIKEVLDIQSWKPVSADDSIPYHEIKSPISLHNGNHSASEILIDTQYNYIFVTVYDADGPQGADNVRQYAYSVGASVVQHIQALVEEIHTTVN